MAGLHYGGGMRREMEKLRRGLLPRCAYLLSIGVHIFCSVVCHSNIPNFTCALLVHDIASTAPVADIRSASYIISSIKEV